MLGDEPTVELVRKAQSGDRGALEMLLQRCLPKVRRWAHGRLPRGARASADTEDVVQAAALNTLKRIEAFEPRHVAAMQAYLRKCVINRFRDEARRLGRAPELVELPSDHAAGDASPLEAAIEGESYERYRQALAKLRARDRDFVVARVESQWTPAEIAKRFGLSTAAAQMAVTRALKRLAALMGQPTKRQR